MVFLLRVDTGLLQDLNTIREAYSEAIGNLPANHTHGDLIVDWSALDYWNSINNLIAPITEPNLPLNRLVAVVGEIFIYPLILREPTLYDRLITPFRLYLDDPNQTKSDLYAKISSPRYRFVQTELLSAAAYLTYTIREVMPDLPVFMNSMKDLYEKAYNLELPILTMDFLANDMVIVNFVREKFKYNQTIIDITEQILTKGINGSDDFMKLIQAMENHFLSLVENLGAQLDKTQDSFFRSMDEWMSRLSGFGNLRSQILKTYVMNDCSSDYS